MKREALFVCLECGKKFYTVGAARKATFSLEGCPGCGGSDIDVYVAKPSADSPYPFKRPAPKGSNHGH